MIDQQQELSVVSFRDPAGFVYRQRGELRRQVNHAYRAHYDHLMSSGLYDELVADQLLVPHEELDVEGWGPGPAYKVIRPEPIGLISYPYEWCFSQYQDAALAALEIQRRAVRRGMSLKDCSAYNLQFHRGRPIFIDTLSFEAHRVGRPWTGYRQFCEHFLAPLALMALCDHRLNQLCRTNVDGVSLDLATRLLPARSRWHWGLLVHLHLHERFQRARVADQSTPPSSSKAEASGAATEQKKMGQTALLGLVDSLESAVRRLHWRPQDLGWAGYDQGPPYTHEETERKTRLVGAFLERSGAASVWDLGANTGAFSRIAAEMGLPTVAFDFEPACVERIYRENRERGEERLMPLLLDLFNPTPGAGWMTRERASIFDRGAPELVMALALVHHLAFTGNQPLDNLARFFQTFSPWLIIEFVPETDPQARSLSERRFGVHHEYNRGRFESCFDQYFETVRTEPVTESGRTLYLMRRRPS